MSATMEGGMSEDSRRRLLIINGERAFTIRQAVEWLRERDVEITVQGLHKAIRRDRVSSFKPEHGPTTRRIMESDLEEFRRQREEGMDGYEGMMDVQDVAERLGASTKIARSFLSGYGIEYVKAPSGKKLYKPEDVERALTRLQGDADNMKGTKGPGRPRKT